MGKAKGTVMIGAVKFLRSRKEEARKVLPEQLDHYLSNRISLAVWYPETDALELIRALVQLMPGDDDEILRTLGIVTARTLGEGIYSHLVREGGTESSIAALWSSMHDTGKLTVTNEEEGTSIFELSGYVGACPEMCTIVGAYIQETLRMGGRQARVKKTGCVNDGAGECVWRATW